MMNRRAALLTLAALTAVSALPTGCKPKGEGGGGDAGGGATIRIGEYGSMTGSESAFGEATHKGVMLAVEEVNSAGGVNGKKLEVVGPEDTESQQTKGEIAVKRLVEKKVAAVIGEVASGISLAGAPVCQSAEIPMISPSSTNPKVTEVGDYIFRVCFIDPFQGGVIAKFATDSLKAKTAAIFYDAAAPYSVGIREEFSKAFAKTGGRVVKESQFNKGDKDFKAQLTTIKAANPDVIIVPGYYTESGTIVKQARDLGITTPIVGGDGWDDAKFHDYAGKTVGNAYFSNHMSVDDPAPEIQAFVKAYRAKYNDKPNALAALGYDSVMVLVDAMKRAKSLSGSDLRDAIAETKDYKGVTGTTTINPERNAEKGAVIMEVKGGEFVYKESIAKEAIPK
jgi:branched-chain amino acid transport system substrate-binding protein